MADVCINIFTDSDPDQLAGAPVAVSARTGVMYQPDLILEALQAAGP